MLFRENKSFDEKIFFRSKISVFDQNISKINQNVENFGQNLRFWSILSEILSFGLDFSLGFLDDPLVDFFGIFSDPFIRVCTC